MEEPIKNSYKNYNIFIKLIILFLIFIIFVQFLVILHLSRCSVSTKELIELQSNNHIVIKRNVRIPQNPRCPPGCRRFRTDLSRNYYGATGRKESILQGDRLSNFTRTLGVQQNKSEESNQLFGNNNQDSRVIRSRSQASGLYGNYGGKVVDTQGTRGNPGRPGIIGNTGSPGHPGIIGNTGSPGRPGIIGNTGSPGRPGTRGNVGSPGRPGGSGNTGYQGSSGSPGLQGPRGPPGITGYPGDIGTPGAPGLPGGTGDSGYSGLPGNHGSPGIPGNQGPPGIQGNQGSPGLPGLPGAPGGEGESGDIGLRGPPGNSGSFGTRGAAGAPGSPGRHGSPGIPGSTSLIGRSSSQYGLTESSGGIEYDGNGYYARTVNKNAKIPIYDAIQNGVEEESSHQTSGPRKPELRNKIRGDQGIPREESSTQSDEKIPDKTDQDHMNEVLKELKLLDHPKCVDNLDHQSLMNKLKDIGKVSFMIMVDLEDSVYCIVHA